MARILIAELSTEVRDLLVHVVARLGHEPVVYSRSQSELPEADVLLLEPAFPAGAALAQALVCRQPELPIVCVSIYPSAEEMQELEPVAYLLKPFTIGELSRALATAVAKAERAPILS